MERRLNVSPGAGGVVMIKRNRFDSHVDGCELCHSGELCMMAQTLWRATVVTALRTQRTGATA